SIPSISRGVTQGGTARTTRSDAPRARRSPSKSRRVARSPAVAIARSRAPKRISPPRALIVASAGSTSDSESPSRGTSGRHAAPPIEDPPRHAAGIGAQRPALARGEIDEGEFRVRRTGQRRAGADLLDVTHRRRIAAEQEMIAVVEAAAELGIEIRAAAAAGM